MESLSIWLAAAPIIGAILLLTPLPGVLSRRRRLASASAVTLLLIASTFFNQCSARAAAATEVERRLFPTPSTKVAVFDGQHGKWLVFSGGGSAVASAPVELRLLANHVAKRQPEGVRVGSASRPDGIQMQLRGTPNEVERLAQALDLVASTRAGQAVLSDTLARNDVTVSFAKEIGVKLPGGAFLTTGGTAITQGKQVYISWEQYGGKPAEALAAMLAHELTHVTQNVTVGTAWWGWPWTTIDREITAHTMQAIVWSELKGALSDWEQERNLEGALDRGRLRMWIMQNPAYPSWLAPNIAC